MPYCNCGKIEGQILMIYHKDYNISSENERVYSSPENRHKHRWPRNYAGFTRYYGEIVGKCPNNITLEEAQQLLVEAIPDPPDEYDDDPYPKRLYNVREGVIYRAEGDGRSNRYHAFPADNINSMDADTLAILEKRATDSGYLEQFRKWKKENGNRRSKV